MKLIVQRTGFGTYLRWFHSWKEPDVVNKTHFKCEAMSELIARDADDETIKQIGIIFSKRLAKKNPFAAKSLGRYPMLAARQKPPQ